MDAEGGGCRCEHRSGLRARIGKHAGGEARLTAGFAVLFSALAVAGRAFVLRTHARPPPKMALIAITAAVYELAPSPALRAQAPCRRRYRARPAAAGAAFRLE